MSQSTYPPITSGTADAALAGVWRKILTDLGIDPVRLDDLVYQYTRKMTHVDVNKRTQWYGNVTSDLKEGSITWSTFLRGPKALGAEKMVMEFILHHRWVRTRHVLIIHYGPPNEPEEVLGPKGEKPPTELYLFFTRILKDLEVSVEKFNDLLTCYMRRILRVENTPVNRSFLRGNYKKNFTDPRLSWANFIKGLDFLTIPELDLNITITFGGKRGKTTHHHVHILINEIKDMLVDMTEDEFLTPPESQVIKEESTEEATTTTDTKNNE